MLHETNQPRPVTGFVQPASLVELARAVIRRRSPPTPHHGPARRLQRQPVSHSAREPFPGRLSKLISVQVQISGAAMNSSAGNMPEDPIRRHRTRPFRCGVWDSTLPGWSHRSRAPCRPDSCRRSSFAAVVMFVGQPVVLAGLLAPSADARRGCESATEGIPTSGSSSVVESSGFCTPIQKFKNGRRRHQVSKFYESSCY
jgi:hypothetical protein